MESSSSEAPQKKNKKDGVYLYRSIRRDRSIKVYLFLSKMSRWLVDPCRDRSIVYTFSCLKCLVDSGTRAAIGVLRCTFSCLKCLDESGTRAAIGVLRCTFSCLKYLDNPWTRAAIGVLRYIFSCLKYLDDSGTRAAIGVLRYTVFCLKHF